MLQEFFELLYDSRPDGSYLLVWAPVAAGKGGESIWFSDIDAAADHIRASKSNIYFQVGLSGADYGPRQRCTVDSERPIVALPALFADIDFGEDGHKGKKYPPTIEDAMGLIHGTGYDPTVVVHSGHGLQAYWVFKEVWETDTDAERFKAILLLNRLKVSIQDRAAQHGWQVDSVQDLVRILRPPESWNTKGEPVQVKIIDIDESRQYNPDDLEELIPECAVPKKSCTQHNSEVKQAADGLIIAPGRRPPMTKFGVLQQVFGSKFIKTWSNSREDLSDKSPSGYDQALATMAAKAGWSSQEIVDLMISHREENSHDLKIKNVQYYARTVITAQETALNESFEADKTREAMAINDELAVDEKDSPEEKLRKRLSMTLGIKILKIEKYIMEPPEFRLYTTEGDAMLKIDDIDSQTRFRRRMMATTSKRPNDLKPREWAGVSQAILDLAKGNQVSVSEEATDVGQVKNWLRDYLEGRTPASQEDAAPLKAPFYDTGRWHLFIEPFLLWLQSKRGTIITSKDLCSRLRRGGCISRGINVKLEDGKYTTRNIWEVPQGII